METREILFENKWYTIGDYIEIKQRIRFLFWVLPFDIIEKWRVHFIGNDSCAVIIRKTKNDTISKTIIGSVKINQQ